MTISRRRTRMAMERIDIGVRALKGFCRKGSGLVRAWS